MRGRPGELSINGWLDSRHFSHSHVKPLTGSDADERLFFLNILNQSFILERNNPQQKKENNDYQNTIGRRHY
jgi:hypothetical protein